MRSIAQALIAATLIASASTPTTAQRSNDDGESGNRDAARALASIQVVHSASLLGRSSPAFADWVCAVHQMNPNKSDNSQDWKISYLTNCSAITVAVGGARTVRSDGDWVLKFFAASGTDALNRRGEGKQGDNEGEESSNTISVTGGGGSLLTADGVVGGSSGGDSKVGLSSAATSGNTAAVTETITNPEPSTILLVSSGLAMLGASAFRRRRS